MSVITNESNISKQLCEFENLENMGIETTLSNDENIKEDIMFEFEAGIPYQNKRLVLKNYLSETIIEHVPVDEENLEQNTFYPPHSSVIRADKATTCFWIKGDSNRHKVFMKNRMQEIQRLSIPKEIHHCIGKDSPADFSSRDLSLNELKSNDKGWHGLKWLTTKETE
ncbi:hypothetical protein NPIL_369311 [Nephila pilipes]|uniref:Uncharacterized protein n=1 Tax=Nephila pilipes TaxID=299642 RepID=A0A8X6TCA7_NEPPI|nr:hypothetical protein NPIL_369311 [Nephila pilipes]